MGSSRLLILSALVFGFLTACSNDDKNDKKEGKLTPQIHDESVQQGRATSLKVLDEDGQALASAQVLIGMAQGLPFQNNLITTSADGTFEVPAEWTTPQPVTVSSQGYIRVTYLSQTPHGQNFVIRKQPAGGSYELKGLIPGIPLSGSRNADFALVIPAFQVQDLFNFRMDMVISSQKDPMSIIGQNANVPSNLIFPRQSQSYGIIPVTLDKQLYRTYFEMQGVKKVFALHGKFPFSPVVDKMRAGKQFTEIINDFQMVSGGLQDVNIAAPSQSANLNANQMAFSAAMGIANGSVGADEVLTGISLAEVQGYLVPTDVKALTPSGRDALKIVPGGKMKVLSVLKRRSEMNGGPGADRISATLVPFSDGVFADHLPILENPRVMSAVSVAVQKISSLRGVVPVATYASLSAITTIHTPIWEVYGPEWVEAIEIPSWPGEAAPVAPPQGKLRWSVSLTAAPTAQTGLDLGPALIQNVSHVTNSSTDF